MTREEIKNKTFAFFKENLIPLPDNPNRTPRIQMGQILDLFPINPIQWEHEKHVSRVREIVQELINSGCLYPGLPDQNSTFPWLTITEFGKEVFLSQDLLPYDPDGYIKALKIKVTLIDDITLAYIGESVSAYNRHQLLSATITLGVASENLMLMLIEKYADWIPVASRQAAFKRKVHEKFISTQYKEFKKEFLNDVSSFPREIQADWETYLDGVFNFIRINRNSAGHPTGKALNSSITYGNLQMFSSYAEFLFKLLSQL